MPTEVPWQPDDRIVETPFDLMTWVDQHAEELKTKGSLPLFDPNSYQSDVYVHGFGNSGNSFNFLSKEADTFFWVLRGEATFKIDKFDTWSMQHDDTFLVPKNSTINFESISENAAILSATMDPKNRSRVGF